MVVEVGREVSCWLGQGMQVVSAYTIQNQTLDNDGGKFLIPHMIWGSISEDYYLRGIFFLDMKDLRGIYDIERVGRRRKRENYGSGIR